MAHGFADMKKMGMVIRFQPNKLEEYKALHAAPWPEMEVALRKANICNYSIFLQEPDNLLFGYWEYVGADFAADMSALGALDITKRWLALTAPCQQPMRTGGQGWSFMPQIYHLDPQ